MTPARTSRLRLFTAFAAVYVIWGSTYLAIRFAVETMPPFTMASIRFLVAGAVMFAVARWRERVRLTASDWLRALVVGALLLACGNGAVVWGQQTVPSGVAALIVASMPLWMVVLDWLRPKGRLPNARTIAGVVLGFAGVAVLIGPEAIGGHGVPRVGAIVILLGSVSWAAGSIYSKRTPHPARPLTGTATQMLCGGAVLAAMALIAREPGQLDLAAISLRSVLALAYLVVFGSIVAFTAYLWLLAVAAPARVSTYAYVNPVIAVLLGWALAGERLDARIGIAAAVIVAAVALITLAQDF